MNSPERSQGQLCDFGADYTGERDPAEAELVEARLGGRPEKTKT